MVLGSGEGLEVDEFVLGDDVIGLVVGIVVLGVVVGPGISCDDRRLN
jgi:hypothetical protein